MKLQVVSKILDANERIAEENRDMFQKNSVFVINLMSSPGAGKTTLLEKTISELKDSLKIAVIEGDIAGVDDAMRIEALGVPVVQINTGGYCHLDAGMIKEAMKEFDLTNTDILFIENVGNLVCPAEFYMGEDIKVMILSITEGHDKPLKYPAMFQNSRVILINKIDLKGHLDVDMQKIRKDIYTLNPTAHVFEVSCKTGEGLKSWIHWLKTESLSKRH
ncbi:MAG: hydrogenase nickel incorporation protein HypB [Thermodesulfovibrionales bacterium]